MYRRRFHIEGLSDLRWSRKVEILEGRPTIRNLLLYIHNQPIFEETELKFKGKKKNFWPLEVFLQAGQ
jgi:hypothetical protein